MSAIPMNTAINPINADKTGVQPLRKEIISVPQSRPTGRAAKTVKAIESISEKTRKNLEYFEIHLIFFGSCDIIQGKDHGESSEID